MSGLVTTFDGLGGGSRLGGAGAILNVNAGSKTAPANASYLNTGQMHDMCWHQGEIHAVHCEADSTITMPWGPKAFRGPYVQKWSGGAWSLVGSSLDPGADVVPAANGDRCLPQCPKIASDGADLFVAYYDMVVTNIGTGAVTRMLRIAHWNGAAWVEVASEAATGGSLLGLCVAAGKAYTVQIGGLTSRLRIFRSDGTAMYLADSGTAAVNYAGTGYPAATVTRAGRPVGFYTKYLPGVTRAVMFDLDTGAVIRSTAAPLGPSPIVPYQTSDESPGIDLSGSAILYGLDEIAVGDQIHGILVVPEDGSADFTTISGDELVRRSTTLVGRGGTNWSLALDPSDAAERKLWFNPGTDQPNGPANIRDILFWQPACSATRGIISNALNSPPVHSVYDTGASIPYPDAFILPASFFWEFYGPVVVLADATNVYAFYLYYPTDVSSPGSTQPYWSQFIVYSFPIVRGLGCQPFYAPRFSTKFKAV